MKTMGAKDHGGGRQSTLAHRPGKAKRSQRATILGKLEFEMGLDMLAAALGLEDESLKAIIQGKLPDADTRYFPHICSRLDSAGIPSSILDGLAPITPLVVKKLKQLAAVAKDRTPLRRNNFKRLAKAFGEKLELLADALDMRLSSITEVADGRLKLDEERFGHLNPRLMRAGFPNGWLNEAEPELSQKLIDGLTALAREASEEEAAEEAAAAEAEASRILAGTSEPQAPPAPEASPAVQPPSSAPADLSFGGITKQLKGAKAPARPKTFEVIKKPAMENNMSTSKKKAGGASAPAATGSKLVGSTLLTPAGAAANLPRGARSAGRALTGRPAPQLPAESGASGKQAAAPEKQGLQGMPPPTHRPATTAKPAANAPAAANPQQPLQRPELVAAVRQAQRRTESAEISREQSIARADALEKLLEGSRRKTKVTLWRDLLGRSLPYWGNIRRGGILFKDDLANDVIKALGLPEGWLDNPTYPPATLSPWVMDPTVPLPTGANDSSADTAAAKKIPGAKKAAGTKKTAASTGKEPAQQEQVAQPQAAATPAPRAPAVAPAPAPVPAAATTGETGFTWSPPANPESLSAPGPIAQALSQTILRLSEEGKLLEQDAMRALYYLMNR